MSLPARYMRVCTEQIHRRYNEWFTTTSVLLTVHDTVAYLDSTLGAVVVRMPPVSEAAGLRYFVKHHLGAPTVTFTAYKTDSVIPVITALALNASAVLESDGEKWHTIP